MTDYMAIVAKRINAGEQVVFYTVGGDTFSCIRELKHRFGLLPTAVCDADKEKQGRAFFGLYGLDVLSPEAVRERYPDTFYFVASMDYRFQIIGFLTETEKVEQGKIINYIPVVKARSCIQLYKLLYDDDGSFKFCCRKPAPTIAAEVTLNTKNVADLRNLLIASLREHRACQCDNCLSVCEDYFPKEVQSWWLNYFCNSNICNFKCSYCGVSRVERPDSRYGKHKLGELIEEFQKDHVLSDMYSVVLSTDGEPLLHPKRKEFYDCFDGYALSINTNGSIYDTDLFDLMRNKKVRLTVSMDAGTPETYQSIKGLDYYEKVKGNLKKYATAPLGLLVLKYIFLPNVNDNEKDVDGFIDLCLETGATYVAIALDYNTLSNITTKTKEMIQRMAQQLRAKQILYVPYTAFETAEYAALIRELLRR